ncbi:hypothetical protein [Vibrio phage JSF12]|uniref:Uncharacterized protein n=2 Tax=Jesfedecavirus TaxID=2560156 RepID=A0A2D0YLN7_9CAUD|nr:tRNA amidotransferase [Vibrio phage JSF10]YP_009794712.1 tRNA amidotransferase [Vibrio phage JSF12]ASV43400.1 hypothetical protein [Vibrio phage JSF10]ASV43547.1 hypothetical protein [Vibrio phage JSF12]
MRLQALKEIHMGLRKERSPYAKAVGVIIASFEDFVRQNKEVNEDMVIGKIKKAIDTCRDNSRLCTTDAEKAKAYDAEADFLESLLPDFLSEQDLVAIMVDHGVTNVGEFMKLLRNDFTGQYDAKLAAKVAREHL